LFPVNGAIKISIVGPSRSIIFSAGKEQTMASIEVTVQKVMKQLGLDLFAQRDLADAIEKHILASHRGDATEKERTQKQVEDYAKRYNVKKQDVTKALEKVGVN
jgi:hypothetical protein